MATCWVPMRWTGSHWIAIRFNLFVCLRVEVVEAVVVCRSVKGVLRVLNDSNTQVVFISIVHEDAAEWGELVMGAAAASPLP